MLTDHVVATGLHSNRATILFLDETAHECSQVKQKTAEIGSFFCYHVGQL